MDAFTPVGVSVWYFPPSCFCPFSWFILSSPSCNPIPDSPPSPSFPHPHGNSPPSSLLFCSYRSPRYEVSSTRFSRDIKVELSIAAVASVFLGFGTLFLALAVGIYV